MRPLNLTEIARAAGGQYSGGGVVSAVFTDSRAPVKNGLFIALRGDSFDGHDYMQSLENTGTAAVICSRRVNCSIPQIIVDDTKKALLRLAEYYRSLFHIPLVALTGSVGKTTTKEMVHCALSAAYNTLKTEGNLNNDIGMPLTLLKIEDTHEAAVIEMGMNHPGEISVLSRTAKPDMAIITNIGVSHIENLGSRENILAAKLEILDGMRPGAKIILNGDDKLLRSVDVRGFDPYYFGVNENHLDMYAADIFEKNGKTEFLVCIDGLAQRVSLPAIGFHNVHNALAACLTAYLLGIPLAKAAGALTRYESAGMRQRINKIAGITFIEDCYNSSPDSVNAAISVLRSIKANKKIAVLGDMLELGDYSETAHSLIGEYAAKAKIDVLFTYGTATAATAKAASAFGVKTVSSFTDDNTLAEMLCGIVEKGDAVLFKASRGMKLETVINKLYEKLGL